MRAIKEASRGVLLQFSKESSVCMGEGEVEKCFTGDSNSQLHLKKQEEGRYPNGNVIEKEFLVEQTTWAIHEAHVLSGTGVVPDKKKVPPVRLRIRSTEILDLSSIA